jgi:hypothetical protein
VEAHCSSTKSGPNASNHDFNAFQHFELSLTTGAAVGSHDEFVFKFAVGFWLPGKRPTAAKSTHRGYRFYHVGEG